MSLKVTESTDSKPRMLDKDRCRYTSAHGRRCLNPLRSATAGFCVIHERFAEQHNDTEAQSISTELLSGGPNLQNRQAVGRVIAQLFTMIAQRRIRQREGALLAYVASLLLQTMGAVTDAASLPVRVVWDIPMEPDHPTIEKNNSDPRFSNQT
jgi:hypothetical protein